MSEIFAHPELSVKAEYIGNDKSPVLIIDNFMQNAERLVDYAAQSRFGVASQFYPGLRAAGFREYAEGASQILTPYIQDVFDWQERDVKPVECMFSVVTTRPENLIPFQRIPHIDGTEQNILALLHYLSPAEMGGTSFYRHKSSGYERMDEVKYNSYAKTLEQEVAQSGLPPAEYISGDTDLYEKIAHYPARFNRAIVYRGASLHSGEIPNESSFSADPREGRLTVNTFIQCPLR